MASGSSVQTKTGGSSVQTRTDEPLKKPAQHAIGKLHERRDYGPATKPGDEYYLSPRWKVTFLAHTCYPLPKPLPFGTWGYSQRRFLHRVGPHRARNLFEGDLGDSLVSLCKESNLAWKSIGLYRQEMEASKTAVTVLVVLSSENQHPSDKVIFHAEALCDSIRMLLDHWNLNDVHGHVVADSGCSRGSDDGDVTPATIFKPLYPGIGIGPKGKNGSGTLSALIRLRDNPAMPPREYALTCHHVASLGREDRLRALFATNSVQMVTPSEDDYDKALEVMQDVLQYKDRSISKQEQKKETYRSIGRTWTPYLEESLNEEKASRMQVQDHLDEFKSLSENERSVGFVIRSSGIVQPSGYRSPVADWALIRITEAQLSERDFYSSKASVFHAKKHLEHAQHLCRLYKAPSINRDSDKPGILSFCSPDEERTIPVAEIKRLCQAEEPTHVYLHGRTTFFGVGILHDVRDRVQTRYKTASGEHAIFSAELVVLDIAANRSRGPFSESGDSGAPIRTADGRLVGTLFGSNEGDELGRPSSYVSMAEDTLAHIKAATGAYKVEFVAL